MNKKVVINFDTNIKADTMKADTMKANTMIKSHTKEYALTQIVLNFCIDELEKYRNIIQNPDIYNLGIISKVMIQYIQTIESLGKL